MRRWLIFTDLDGTLLDEDTYSYLPASAALERMKRMAVPVIPCTSKTAMEVVQILSRIGQEQPFIVENGSAIFFGEGYFNTRGRAASMDGYEMILLGAGYEEILAFFRLLKKRFDLPAKGLSEMQIAEIQAHTGLSEAEARLAGIRAYSEPFVLYDGQFDLTPLEAYIRENGFRLLKGNRFYHLLGNSDKGHAVRRMSALFSSKYPDDEIRTIGIGDSKNDLEMLHAVDHPVLVRKNSGIFLENVSIKNLIITDGAGPAGWQEAVDRII